MKRASIQELFDQAAERFPDNTAIEVGDYRISYAGLAWRANQLANHLTETGAGKGEIICILAANTINVVTALLATLKAGCVFVPLDPRLPRKRLEAMIAHAGNEWFLAEPEYFESIAEMAGQNSKQIRVVSLGEQCPASLVDGPVAVPAEFESQDGSKSPDIQFRPDDMCYLYFTSGSTGAPKGIAGRLKSIAHFIEWEIKTLGLGEGVRVSQFTTPAFDASLRDFLVPLCAGGTICAPTLNVMGDAQKLVQWIDGRKIELIHCVPSLLRMVMNEELGPHHFPSLKYILTAGEPLLPSDVKRCGSIFGSRIELINLYGPSETTMVKLFYRVKAEDQDRIAIPIGQPMQGTAALVVDEKGRACPLGIVGEIYIRTPYRSLGYYKQPELTAQVFIPNPFSKDPDDIVYKTGDLGRVLPDGNFEFLGRRDHQVKIRGVRIELLEIENLLRTHEAVKDVVIVDREDRNGDKYLCAYVVLQGKADSETLREFLLAAVPDYMVPSAFITMYALPRSINGKVDRKALPSPEQARRDLTPNYVAPRTQVEQMLAGIWAQVLGIPRVGIHDNFFVLGGHSLLAMQLLSRVRSAFDVEIPLRSLFKATTVADLSVVVAQAQAEQEDGQEISQLLEEIKDIPDDILEELVQKEIQESSSVG